MILSHGDLCRISHRFGVKTHRYPTPEFIGKQLPKSVSPLPPHPPWLSWPVKQLPETLSRQKGVREKKKRTPSCVQERHWIIQTKFWGNTMWSNSGPQFRPISIKCFGQIQADNRNRFAHSQELVNHKVCRHKMLRQTTATTKPMLLFRLAGLPYRFNRS